MAENERMGKYKSLDHFKIPHELKNTDEFVRWLMRIAETKPFLDEYLGSPLELNLLRRAKVRAVTASNQIEGNHLKEEEVTAVLDGKKVGGSQKDIKEVHNYREALDYVEKLAKEKKKIKERDFCDIQRLVTSDLLPKDQIGQYRKIDVSIVDAETKYKIQDCPPPHSLRDLIDDLWKWLEDTEGANPFARAFGFHFIAVSIHPFTDGNGRTVRLMQHLLLLKDGQGLARFVPSETAIMKNRDRYYSTLKQCRSLNSVHPILEFLAECFAVSAEEVIFEGKGLLKKSAQRKPQNRHKRIVEFGTTISSFSIKDILEILPGVPRRTIERDLESLTAENQLKATGEKKARSYQLKSKKR